MCPTRRTMVTRRFDGDHELYRGGELRDHELDKVSGGLDAGKNEVAVEGVVSVGDDVSMKSGPSNYNKKNVTMIRDAPIVLG